MNFRVGVNQESGYREVVAGQADYQETIPPTEYAGLARRYGVNKGQFRVAPANCTSYIGLNNANPLFRNNVRLRKAVNYVINRQAMVQLSGAYGGRPHDQILPMVFPGFRNASLYPNRPNIARARGSSHAGPRGAARACSSTALRRPAHSAWSSCGRRSGRSASTSSRAGSAASRSTTRPEAAARITRS